jgi:hypothetical protein
MMLAITFLSFALFFPLLTLCAPAQLPRAPGAAGAVLVELGDDATTTTVIFSSGAAGSGGGGQFLSIPSGAVLSTSGNIIAVEVFSTVYVTSHHYITAGLATSTAASETSSQQTGLGAEFFQDNSGVSAAFSSQASTAAATVTSTAVKTSTTLDATSQAWVDAHNAARAEYGAGNVGWSADLVSKAQANAVLCTGSHTSVLPSAAMPVRCSGLTK